jgi:hypothetical protein
LDICRSNTVFEHAVLTLHLETQCLAKMANSTVANTVFGLFNN